MHGLDAYTVRARVAPAFLVALPAALAVLAWFPQFSLTSFVSGAVTWVAIGVLAGQLGRDGGKKSESALFAGWGGGPATAMLRHRDTRLNRITRARYHTKLAALTGERLPSPGDEVADPRRADEVYESCVHFLREATRDKKMYPLVFAENVGYGFRRNLWGMRAAGLVLALAAASACGLRAGFEWLAASAATAPTITGAVGAAVLAALWIARFRRGWVKLAADAYGRALLATCDQMHAEEVTAKSS